MLVNSYIFLFLHLKFHFSCLDCTLSPCNTYLHNRERLVTAEKQLYFDSDIVLTPDETKGYSF